MYHDFLIHSSAPSRLLPCPGYYKQHCDEHWGTCVSFSSGFLAVYAQQWVCWVIRQFYFQFFKGISTLFSIVAILMRWMKLEPIIQSEVSQKEKHQYSILTHIYKI